MRYIAIMIAILCLTFTLLTTSILSAEIKAKQTTTNIQKSIKEKDATSEKVLTPPWWVYLTGVIAALNFGWLVIFNIFQFNKSRSESIRDKYWFRKILLPICINPLNEFANSQTLQLKSVEDDALTSGIENGARNKLYKEYLGKFGEEKNNVINRFMVLLPVHKELYVIVSRKLDELEDSVTEYCKNKSFGTDMGNVSHPGQVIFTSLGEIMMEISKKHSELF